jgi:very-short-patch-repair endonuclease
LRQTLSPPERLLWIRLRQRSVNQPNFRRQHALGPYVADFYCADAKMVVEIDGWGHSDPGQISHDARRDEYMHALGYRVVRYWAGDVMKDPDGVAQSIYDTAAGLIAAP